MPVLREPKKRVMLDLPPRKARLAARTGVLVVGGGPAGLGAAAGAAQAGVETVLVERHGFLGGNATAALVMPLMSFHTWKGSTGRAGDNMTFLPSDHGPGEPVIAGALAVLLDKLVKNRGAVPPSQKTGYVVPFDPEVFKITAMEMMDDLHVKMLFHSFASSIYEKNKKRGVVFETKSGPVVIEADVIVDCTGDGDIAASAGADFMTGREIDHLLQPMTMMFRMVEFEREAFSAFIRKHPGQWKSVYGLWDLIKIAARAGELDLQREDILFFDTIHEKELSVNSSRIINVSGVNVWDLSFAEWEGRRQIRQIAAFFKKYVPGFENAYLVQSGVTVGVRETRRIKGKYILSVEDVLNARKFDDVIARSSYPVDVHNPSGKGTTLKRLPPGEAYDIPLRCLIPGNTENILVAGRCISGDHEAHSSYRVMPTSMATGQAAGICAAIASVKKKDPSLIDPAWVQKELLRQGANLGERIYRHL
jgi:hypothetical protein